LNADDIKRFGSITIVDPAAETKGDKAGSPDKAGDAPASTGRSAKDVATQLSSRAEFDLQAAHKGSKYTITGASPKVLDYNDSFKVVFPQTLDLVVTLQLGPDISAQQRAKYIQALATLNKDKLTDDGHGNKSFAAGATIKLPGQTKDGGVTWRTADGNMTEW